MAEPLLESVNASMLALSWLPTSTEGASAAGGQVLSDPW